VLVEVAGAVGARFQTPAVLVEVAGAVGARC